MLKNKGMRVVALLVLALVVLTVILFAYMHFWISRPKLNQLPKSVISHPSTVPRQKPLVNSRGLKAEGESTVYRINSHVRLTAYKEAISAAWQELVDKGFAQRDNRKVYLVTVHYPKKLGSTEAVTAVVDVRKPIEMELVDQPQPFGISKINLNLAVKNKQLLIKLYQSGSYDDQKAVGALSLAFDVMAIGTQPHYRGRRPVITAFSELLQPQAVKLLERK